MFGFLNVMAHVFYYLMTTEETKLCMSHSDEMNTGKTSAMLFFGYKQGLLSRLSEYLASGGACLESGLTA